MTLKEKVDEFDKQSLVALGAVENFIELYGEEIVHASRGRLVEGHFRYGDKYMYELTEQELLAEILQELADAVNYYHRILTMRETHG